MEIDSNLRSKEIWLVSEDGLWDISFGLVMLGWGLTTTLRHPLWFISLIMVAYFLVLMAGKEVITRPRMAYFSIADDHLIKLSNWVRIGISVVIIGLIFGTLVFWVFGFGSILSGIQNFGENLIFLILSVVTLALGHLAQKGNRFYFYACISIVAFLAFEFLNLSNFGSYYFAGMLVIITGIFLLIRFVHRYPKSEVQDNIHI